ncbi:hypothetical protein CHU00_16585 [Sphingobacterium cellulitidis]|uniref:O-antigen polymerase n=1 Tax=Sphingobacterium cellulitidis TaxID=1768011 RepID=UPI000B93D4DC|nr:O-antigen polymerase [Sphingobacterium cellulitidis]OYD44532.1 hypothetical protein CHU00_16585 [Sphingobacterium cellulitidis]
MLKRNIGFFLELIILTLVSLLYFFWGGQTTFSKDYLICILSIALISCFVFFGVQESEQELKKQYIKHSNLFLLGFLIVHFQFYIDYAFNNFSASEIEIYFVYFNIINKAVTISVIALITYFLGYLSFRKPSNWNKTTSIYRYSYSNKIALIVGVVSFGIYLITTDIRYFLGGYGSIERPFLSSLSEQIVIASLFSTIIIGNLMSKEVFGFLTYLRSYPTLFWLLLVPYFIITLNSGDRGPILYTSIAFFVSFVILSRKKFKLITIGVFIFIGSMLIMFAAIVRGLGQEGTFMSKVEYALSHGESYKLSAQSFSPNTFELAISVRAYHSIINSYESIETNHTYGAVTLYQLLGTVPGLGSVFSIITGLTEKELSSPRIATNLLGANYGMGTSCVADSYLDFGIVSVIILFFIFGRFCRNMELTAFIIKYRKNLFLFITSIVLISFAIYIGRSTLFVFLRMSFLCYLLIIVGRVKINAKKLI